MNGDFRARVELPAIADVTTMPLADRVVLLAQLESIGTAVAELRGAVHALLHEADCADKDRPIQTGRVDVWRAVLGDVHAVDLRRDHLDTICRGWRKIGPSWEKGKHARVDGTTIEWEARKPDRVRPLSGGSCNRYLAVLRRAFRLGREKRGLLTPLTYPHFEETARGEYLTEDQCRAICTNDQAKHGAAVKSDVFRLAYLLGVRKGQLQRTCKRHVLITAAGTPQETWKLRWPGEETKNGKPHEIVLVGEPRAIVQRAWTSRLPDCDLLFHVNGKLLGPMISALQRTCALLGIPYGRGRGVVWHDTRHSAVSNLVAAGVPEVVAMAVTGHADATVFKRYNVRRDDVQAAALERLHDHLAGQRGTTAIPPRLGRPGRH